jgi:hypothetical protein
MVNDATFGLWHCSVAFPPSSPDLAGITCEARKAELGRRWVCMGSQRMGFRQSSKLGTISEIIKIRFVQNRVRTLLTAAWTPLPPHYHAWLVVVLPVITTLVMKIPKNSKKFRTVSVLQCSALTVHSAANSPLVRSNLTR